MTLWRNRTRPSTPPSLVKLASLLASVRTGRSSSRPTSPQVPQEIQAAWLVVMGTATTADAVSCDPTAVTGVWAESPVSAATAGSRVPSTVPGFTSGGKMFLGKPRRAMRSSFQLPSRESSPVVDALVTSALREPVSRLARKSGMSSTESASWSLGLSAASWYRVLNGRNCSPFWPYSSANGTRE